jgi:hypothetical protein
MNRKGAHTKVQRNRIATVTLLLVGLLIPISGFGQKSTYKGFPSLVWPKLYDIRFEKAKDNLGDYEKPIFSAAAKTLNGKTITLPGYMVPFENGLKGSRFMLSSMPLNACFFCGVGGPETVVEVFLKEPMTYTERPVQIRGVLKLNETDPDKMLYVLENAEFDGDVDF